MITRFEQDMDGSMCPEDGGQWVRFDDLVAENAALAGTKLYPRPDPRVVELEGIIRHASQVKTLDDNLIAELEAQNARLTELNSQLCAKSNSYVIYNARLEEQIAALLAVIEAKDAALEKIACVGNGNSHGNSVGNCMAIEALAAKRETDYEENNLGRAL